MLPNKLELVAELSGNHNGSKQNLLDLVTAAEDSGATCIKIQCFTPDTITANSSQDWFKVTDGPWAGSTLFELYSKTYLPWEWYDELFSHADRLGIEIFGSVFDEKSADFLSQFNSEKVKIASPEIIDLKLIDYASRLFERVIVSTGMSSKKEVFEAATVVKEKRKYLTLLQCVSEYPAKPESYNLQGLKYLSTFSNSYGISDHALADTASIGAVALGATLIEKHFTLNRSEGGIDSHFSLEPNEFLALSQKVNDVFQACAVKDYEEMNSDSDNQKYRRSLFYSCDIAQGTLITEKHIKCIRPGVGLHPSKEKLLIGKKLKYDVETNQPIDYCHFLN